MSGRCEKMMKNKQANGEKKTERWNKKTYGSLKDRHSSYARNQKVK